MKKLLSIILSLMMISSTFTGLGITVNASEIPSAEVSASETDFTYTVNDDGNAVISGYSGTDTEVEVPDTIDGYKVVEIGESAFFENTILTSITLPYGLQKISEDAFYGCSSLISIEIPDSVTSIGNSVFYKCSSLTSIKIPDSVISIDHSAFHSCKNLTSIEIPDSVTSIGKYAFGQCSSLTSIKIPNSVTSINYGTFWGCSSLTSIEIPDSVTSIGGAAFDSCESLTSIKIPDSITSIGNSTFGSCKSLSSIKIPYSVTEIGSHAFFDCNSLTSIEIPDSVTSIGMYAFGSCGSLTSIEIPDSVTSIGGYVFRSCSKLTSVKLPDSITSIGDYTFAECISLTSIEIPDSVASIGSYAFYFCSSLKSIEIPSGTSIGEEAFSNLDLEFIMYGYTNSPAQIYAENNDISFVALDGEETEESDFVYEINEYGDAVILGYNGLDNHVIIPDFIDGYIVTEIAPYAFHNNQNIVYVEIPKSVNIIGMEAFEGCEALKSVRIDNYANIVEIQISTFSHCTSLEEIVFPERLERISNMAFSHCTSLRAVELPDQLAVIDSDAFYGCSSLEYIVIPKSVNYIGYGAFGYVSYGFYIQGYAGTYAQQYANENQIRFVVLGTPFTYDFYGEGIIITDYYGDSHWVEIPEEIDGYRVVAIGDFAFENDSEIVEVVIPDTVTSVGFGAFMNCTRLEYVSGKYDSNIEMISSNAFSGCSELRSIVNLRHLRRIDDYAFAYCTNLDTFVVNESVEIIGYSVFAYCENLKSIDILGTPYISDGAFEDTAQRFYIRGEKDSTVHQYARNNNIHFFSLEDEVDQKTGFAYRVSSNHDGTATIVGYIGTDTEVIIPEYVGVLDYYSGYEVVAIGEGAFAENNEIVSVSIPETVIELGIGAFAICKNLISVELPSNISEIPEYAFYDCHMLFEIKLPDPVKKIGDYAFYYCDSLEEISFSDKLQTIGDYAFEYCSNLDKVVIPRDTTIGYAAFWVNNDEFVMYGYTNSPAQKFARENEIAFACLDSHDFIYRIIGSEKAIIVGYVGTDIDIVIPDTIDGCEVVAIEDNAFDDCADIESVVMPDTVTAIGMAAFLNCIKLKTISIPDAVTEINALAFQGCESLTSVKLPDGLQTLGDYAFYGCTNLTSIVIPESITKIGMGTFRACDSLESVTLHDGIQSIGKKTFAYCTSLVEIVIPKETTIDDTAFEGVNPELVMYVHFGSPAEYYARENWIDYRIVGAEDFVLDIIYESGVYIHSYDGTNTEVEIPNKIGDLDVLGIMDRAFYGLQSITSVSIPSTVQMIGSEAFAGCTGLTSITIPEITTVCEGAFSGVSPDFIIYGYTDSSAQSYAKENGITFIPLDVVKGDMSGDGVVDINDVTDIQKLLINADELTEEQLYAADVDDDGIVCVRDATQVQKYLAGIVDTI